MTKDERGAAMRNSISKEERATIFNRLVEKAGVPSWGRASRVSSDCEVSPATAAGWLSGSLPRDCLSLLHCTETYNIDVYEWVTGQKKGQGLNTNKLKTSIERLRQYETDNGVRLDPDKFSSLAVMLYEDGAKGEFLLANASLLSSE